MPQRRGADPAWPRVFKVLQGPGGWCPPGQDPTRKVAEDYVVAGPWALERRRGATPGQGEVPALFPDPLWTRSSLLRLTQRSLVSSCPLTPQTPNTGSQLSAVWSPSSPCTFWGLWLVSGPTWGNGGARGPAGLESAPDFPTPQRPLRGKLRVAALSAEDCKRRWAVLPVMVGLALWAHQVHVYV